MKFIPIFVAAGLAIASARAATDSPRPDAATLSFRKHCLDRAFRSEGAAVADFNRDGTLDIACGGVYYAGPDWQIHPMMHAMPKEFNPQAYSDAFLCFAEDVNKDSWPDLIVVGFPGKETAWLENPKGAGGVWKKHMAVGATGNESPCWTDVDGDGASELVFMAGNRCSFAAPDDDPTFPWLVRAIAKAGDPGAGHGLGVGDVNGDGLNDVLIPAGWWEGPKDAATSPWHFHAAKLAGSCAQICVYDCDGDNKVFVGTKMRRLPAIK